MKKLLSIAAVVFFMLNHVAAQTKSRESKIGLGIDIAIPAGAYQDQADYGLGFSLLYQKPVTDHLSITGNIGYVRFHGPAVFDDIKYREGYVPIKAGARYFIAQYFFAAAELGIAIPTANGYGSGTAFAYAPGIGVSIPVTKTGTLDVGIRYENWSRIDGTRSFAGIRAGYNF
jgi:hypothetical protein